MGRPGAWAVFAVWCLCVTIAGAYLTGNESVTDFLSGGLAPGVTDAAREARYFLGSDCGLSASAAQSLVRRGRLPGFREHVILTAELPELATLLSSAGFSVERASSVYPQPRHFPAGGPWLQLADARGKILFDGPYRIFSVKL